MKVPLFCANKDFINEWTLVTIKNRRGVIIGKAGKAASLPKFSDMLTLSQSERAHIAPEPYILSEIAHRGILSKIPMADFFFCENLPVPLS